MSNIFNVFGPSPISPLEQHMHTVYRCAKCLLPFFEAVLQKEWTTASNLQKKISQLETDADHIKRDLRLHLPAGLFLPVSRTDLLELLSVQDHIANTAEDIASLIVSRQMHIPDSIAASFMAFLTQSLDAARKACQAINELDELLEAGFRGKELRIVEEMIVNLDTIEHECDEKLLQIRHLIFELEQHLPTLDVLFLYKVVHWIGDLADHAQLVGARLQILIAR